MITWLIGVLCKGLSSGITSSTSTVTKSINNNLRSEIYSDENINNSNSNGDWSYLFMPEPIAGGTTHIETMYDDD